MLIQRKHLKAEDDVIICSICHAETIPALIADWVFTLTDTGHEITLCPVCDIEEDKRRTAELERPN